jgi:hypothetical protein
MLVEGDVLVGSLGEFEFELQLSDARRRITNSADLMTGHSN